MENLLTAYNEQVRKYTAAPGVKAKSLKQIRMAMFEACFGGIFEKAFTKARKAVLDEIIYKSAETGIYAAKAETIAANCELSVKTVTRAVAEIKKSDEYVIAYSATGRKGGYIFIDRKHENFATIMVDLFGEKVAADFIKTEHEGEQESEQQNAETPTAPTVEAAKTDESTVLSALDASKQEPKNLNNATTSNNAIKTKEHATAIYVRLSEVLAQTFGKNEMKFVMRKLESMRKNMTISDDIAVAAALETANDSKCRNFFALWSYKIKVALGIINPQAKAVTTKPMPKAFSNDSTTSPAEELKAQIAGLKAQRERNNVTNEQPAWFYDDKIKRAEKRLAELTNAPAPKTDDSPFDFAAEVARIKAEANAC